MAEYRDLKNRTRFSSTLDKELCQRLKEHSEKTSIPISKIIDKALEMYLNSVEMNECSISTS